MSKTTNEAFKMLDDFIEFVGEENVVQMITNNTANFEAARDLLMQKNGEYVLDAMCCPLH